MITGVVGVILWTSNLDAMRTFYRDTLRLPLHSDHGDFVAFRFGDMRLSLGLHGAVEGPAKDPYRIMINLGADDIHAEHRRLTEEGVEFVRPPEQESWGGWVATLKDPDANLVQLLQLLPQISPKTSPSGQTS